MAKFPNAIVITGSIASGKSTCVALLKMHGYAIIDADEISHEQLEICAQAVVAEFGEEILAKFDKSSSSNLDKSSNLNSSNKDGANLNEPKFNDADEANLAQISSHNLNLKSQISALRTPKIDRKKLGAIVFNDKAKLKWLENLLHPRIEAEICARCERLEAHGVPYFVDIPLYFEGLGQYEFERVVLVYAPRDTMIARLMGRNGLNLSEANARVNLQMDIEKKRELADFIIDNSGDLANLQSQLEKFLAQIEQKGNSNDRCE